MKNELRIFFIKNIVMNDRKKLNEIISKWLDKQSSPVLRTEDTDEELYITHLKLTKWPKELEGKEHLIKKLNCSSNELKSLPDNLINLEELDCSLNQLKNPPDNLINLKRLNCFRNKLKSLPNLANLEDLNCYGNRLTSLRGAQAPPTAQVYP